MTTSATCPNCDVTAEGGKIEKIFGYRIIYGKSKVQSWCKECRSGKETETKEDPEILRKISSEIQKLAKSLSDKESVIDLFVKGLNFRYDEEPLSTVGWSKAAQKIVEEYGIKPTRIAEYHGLDVIFFEISSDEESKWKKVAIEILNKHGGGFSIVISHKPNSHKWIFSESQRTGLPAKHLPIEIGNEGISSSFVDWLCKIRSKDNDSTQKMMARMNSALDEFALEIQAALGDNVFAAFRSLIEGLIFEKSNKLKFDNETLKGSLNPLFTLLYRIMFVLFAESRQVFDTDNETYYADYSMKRIVSEQILEWERNQGTTRFKDDFIIWNRLKKLFRLIERGSKDLKVDPNKLEMNAYGGSLFDSDLNGELEQWKFNNKSLLDTIKSLVRVEDKDHNRSFVNYESLEIRHIGTIYEKLLEFHPVKVGNKIEIWNDKGEKQSTGTHYTPKFIVDNIVKNALGPIVDRIIKENATKDDQIDKILDLKILDPSMGSAHFLVAAANYLGKRIYRIDKELDFVETKRKIVRRCLYGVDVNPLAVELAKMSLWLDTLAKDHALSFLATHLKNGNAIKGAKREEIFDPQESLFEDRSRSKFRDFVRKYSAFETTDDKLASAVKSKIDLERDSRKEGSEYDQMKYLLDRQVSKYFGEETKSFKTRTKMNTKSLAISKKKEGDWRDLRAKIGTKEFPDPKTDPDWSQTRKTADEQKFFHWELEFPQIFFNTDGDRLENSGFDVVIGNPPYGKITDSKDVEYYRQKFELGSNDLYGLFMKHSFDLLKNDGVFSMIVSDTWRTIRTYKPLREFLLKFKFNRFIKLSRYAFKSPGENLDVFTIICEIEKTPPNGSSYTYYDFWGVYPLNEKEYFTHLLNHTKYTKEKDDWEFEITRTQRYKVKQELISKCEWLPVFDGSEKLFMFLDKDAPKSEVEI